MNYSPIDIRVRVRHDHFGAALSLFDALQIVDKRLSCDKASAVHGADKLATSTPEKCMLYHNYLWLTNQIVEGRRAMNATLYVFL